MDGITLQFKFEPEPMVMFIELGQRRMANASAPGLKRAFEDMGTIYLQFLRRRYIRYSTGGGNWPPNKPATIAAKGGDKRILIHSGRQYGALQRGSPDCIFGVDKNGLTIASMVPYERYHNTGTRNLPVRRTRVRPDAHTRGLMKSAFVRRVNEENIQMAQRTRRFVTSKVVS